MFSERIRKRKSLWWGPAPSYRDRLHRSREQFASRTHLDPDDRWRCCERWQRSLSNKWNAREFARKHGCKVPALYWYGRRLARLSLEKLPSSYVIKPALGQSCRHVYVMSGDIDLMRRRRFAAPELRAQLIDTYGRVSLVPLLVEEFVGAQEPGQLAIDYKCHVFGDVVAAIEVVARESAQHARYTFYTADWEPFTRPLVTAKYEPGATNHLRIASTKCCGTRAHSASHTARS